MIGALIARWFRKPAPTGVSVSLAPDYGRVNVWNPPVDHFAGERHAPGSPPVPLTWRTWAIMQAQEARDGWSFCRFGIRNDRDDGLTQVFGIVNCGLGIYSDTYHVCGYGETILWSLHHLRSGLGCGLFTTPNEAGEAGEVALRLRSDIENGLQPEEWLQIKTAWQASGLKITDVHAHQLVDGKHTEPKFYIWQRDWTLNERPEKLS